MNLKEIVRKGIATVGLVAAIGAGAEGLIKNEIAEVLINKSIDDFTITIEC